jgi:hypothetical protein
MLAEQVDSRQLKIGDPHRIASEKEASTYSCELTKPLGLFFVQLQVDVDVFLAVEARYRARLRLRGVFFRVNLIVDIGIETAEAIVALIIGNGTADGIAACVL